MPRATRNSAQDMDDNVKSLSDWKKHSAEALKLKCGTLKLVTVGNKVQLAQRLVEYFQQVNEHLNHQLQHDLEKNSDTDIRFTREVVTDANKENNDNNVTITNSELLAELRSIDSKFQHSKTDNIKRKLIWIGSCRYS